MKTILLFATLATLAFAAQGQKFTEGTERVASVAVSYAWVEGQSTPDSAQVTASAAAKVVNDADPNEARDARARTVTFNGLRTDRSVTIGGTTLNYQQILRFVAAMSKDAADRPQATAITTATPGNGQVALTWVASERATSYTVKRGTASGGPYSTTVTTGVTGTTYTNTGLSNGTTYYFVVMAVNAGGNADDSAQAIGTPLSP